MRYKTGAVEMANKPGVENGEKQSPTDLQEIQLQMNATTDEVRVLRNYNSTAFIIRRTMRATALIAEAQATWASTGHGNAHTRSDSVKFCAAWIQETRQDMR